MNKNALFTLLLCTMVCATKSSFGQSSWRQGEITLRNGTTLSGEVNDLEWNFNPKKIQFREPGKEPVEYDADQLSTFRTDRPALYQGVVVKYDAEAQSSLAKMSSSRMPTVFETDTVFLEIIVDSDLRLGKMRGSNGRVYFFMGRGDRFEELVNRDYRSARDEIVHNSFFRQQLAIEAKDCPGFLNKLNSLAYRESALISVIQGINKCRGFDMKTTWDKQVTAPPVFVGVLFSPHVVKANFRLVQTEYSGDVNYGLGLFTERFSRKRPTRSSMYYEINFRRFSQSGYSDISMSQYSIRNLRIKGLMAFRFSAPTKLTKGRNYMDAGVSFGRQLASKGELMNRSNEILAMDHWLIGFGANVGRSFNLSSDVHIVTGIRYEQDFVPKLGDGFANSGTFALTIALSVKD